MIKSVIKVSIFIGIIVISLYTGRTYAQPPFEVPPTGGLPVCMENLNLCNSVFDTCTGNLGTCTGDLGTCTGDLGTCTGDLGTCTDDLTMCQDDLAVCGPGPDQIFPGDGVVDDPFEPDLPGHGPALSYTNNLDGTFTDDNTGDMWEIKTAVGSVHNVSDTYSWSTNLLDPNGTLFTEFLFKLNNTCQNDETINCSANGDADCAGVGGGCGFAGYRDWCIPNIKRLQSLVDYSVALVTTSVPPETANNIYWSSTSKVDHDATAFYVDFKDGYVSNSFKSTSYSARAVRPCP